MNKSQFLSFALGLSSGLVVGVGAVLLLAPQSGSQTRQSIRDKVTEILESGRTAIAERRQELTEEYQSRIQIPLPPAEPGVQ
jgi:gas vesicle protein